MMIIAFWLYYVCVHSANILEQDAVYAAKVEGTWNSLKMAPGYVTQLHYSNLKLWWRDGRLRQEVNFTSSYSAGFQHQLILNFKNHSYERIGFNLLNLETGRFSPPYLHPLPPPRVISEFDHRILNYMVYAVQTLSNSVLTLFGMNTGLFHCPVQVSSDIKHKIVMSKSIYSLCCVKSFKISAPEKQNVVGPIL
jgi:hypothetical protein